MVLFEGSLRFATNNIGEFLAIVQAMIFLKDRISDLPIYSDSSTAILWVRNGKCRTTIGHAKGIEETFRRIREAEAWLSDNEQVNRVLKWDTRAWGEIPADYGRK